MKTNYFSVKALELNIHAAIYLKSLSRYNINFELWKQNVLATLKNIFGQNSPEYRFFTEIKFCDNSNRDFALKREVYFKGLASSIELLTKCIEQITPEPTSLDILLNVQEYLQEIQLSQMEKRKILKQLKEITNSIEKPAKSQAAWHGEILQNSIVKHLNKLISLYTEFGGSE